MSAPGHERLLFVDHASRLAGAELVLLDVVPAFPASDVLLFEDGPLVASLQATGLGVRVARHAPDMTGIRRDGSLLKAARVAGGMGRLVGEIAADARRHDAIYANSQKAFVLSALAAPAARRPLIWHLHDILTVAHFGRTQIRLVVALANRLASAVIVPSQAAADAFVAAGGAPALLRVVANGIDPAPDAASRSEIRAALGLDDGFTFGVFSRLSPWKGQLVALEALARLPGAHCVIAGDALFGEEAYAASLRQRAETLGISDRVHFIGHRGDVPVLMRGMDAVLHPSVDPEPFGRTLVEAMLARTPVVASAAGAAGEILQDGRTGILVPPGDVAATAAALDRIRQAPGDIAAIVAAAETRARTDYTVARMRAGVAAAVASAFDQRRKARGR